jgi:hypothetical protein
MTQPSWPGLTGPSVTTRQKIPLVIDGRVKPGHDGGHGAGGACRGLR